MNRSPRLGALLLLPALLTGCMPRGPHAKHAHPHHVTPAPASDAPAATSALAPVIAAEAVTPSVVDPAPSPASPATPSPVVATPAPAVEPPGPLASRAIPVPPQVDETLANGLTTSVITVGALPLVELRLVVRSGNGEGKNPALAALTAELMKDGGTKRLGPSALLDRMEALGADLHVDVGADVTTFAVSATRSRWSEALELLAMIVREPSFDAGEFRKIRARMVDEAKSRSLSSGRYLASQALAQQMYAPGSRYASFGLRPADLEKATVESVADYWRSHFTPSNARLFVAGRVSPDEAKPVVDKHLGAWSGRAATPPPPVQAVTLGETRVVVLDKPSAQSDVYIARFGSSRADSAWPAMNLAIGVLGGGETSRLFTDVREAKSLAYSTSARTFSRAAGPVPLTLYAGTKTASTKETVAALLEQAELLRRDGFQPSELESMRRYLRDSDLVLLETVGDVVGEAVAEWRLGLTPGTLSNERAALATVPESDVRRVMNDCFAPPFLIVVAGDANVIADDLRSFGAVTVVDAQSGLTKATLPKRESP
jgi:predicted Zn-dependent peptidase